MSKKQDKQALNAYQLASLMGSAGEMYAYHNPAQAQFAAAMTDSAKGSIAAQTQYMAAKKAKEKSSSGLGALAGTVGGALLAAPTGGTSMLAGAMIGGGLGGAGESAAYGDYGGAARGLLQAGLGAAMPVAAAPGALSATPLDAAALATEGITATAAGGAMAGGAGLAGAGLVGANLASATSASGTPTGSGGTLEPVQAKSLDENIPAMSAPPVDAKPAPVLASPSLESRKQGLEKLDFSTLETPQRYGMMSAMADAGMQPSREQWNALTPEEQKYWQERGVQPPQSKWVSGVQAVANALAGMGY